MNDVINVFRPMDIALKVIKGTLFSRFVLFVLFFHSPKFYDASIMYQNSVHCRARIQWKEIIQGCKYIISVLNNS